MTTQGSSILILFVQYILPTNLNKCIYYCARTYSILIYLVGGPAHEYTDMCWCCIHFKFIYIPLQSRSTIKIQALARRSEQISVICYLAWVLRKQLANMSIKIVQISQFCVKTVSLYQECRIRSGHNSSVHAGSHIGSQAQQVSTEWIFFYRKGVILSSSSFIREFWSLDNSAQTKRHITRTSDKYNKT